MNLQLDKKLIKQCILNFSLENLIIVKIIPFYNVAHENKILFVAIILKMWLRGPTGNTSKWIIIIKAEPIAGPWVALNPGQLGILEKQWTLKLDHLCLNPIAYELHDLGWVVNISDHRFLILKSKYNYLKKLL